VVLFVSVKQGGGLRLHRDTALALHLELVHKLGGAICTVSKQLDAVSTHAPFVTTALGF
jgi:hypothetical protein